MATGFAAAGMLKAYVTPIAAPADSRRLLGRALRRRARPPLVPGSQLRLESTVSELAVIASQRLHAPRAVTSGFIRRRNRAFDNGVRRHLEGGDAAVVAAYGAGLATLRRASELGVPSFLEYPIAHHAYSRRLLVEEARLCPEFSGTLQYHRLPAYQERRLDEEIEAADRVFVLSAFQRQTFVECGVNPAKLLLTPLGVDLELFRPQPRPDDGVFRVIFVGQITQRKGISYLLDAFRMAALPRSELVFVGNTIGEVRAWKSEPGVRHVTHVPRWQLPECYARADVFVLPSLIEGFPMTALEAMACGKAVIISEHTFGEDVVTDGVEGFIVPIRDAEAITDRLCALRVDSDLRSRMGAAARRRAEHFSWQRYGQRVVGLVRGAQTEEATLVGSRVGT